MERDVTVTLLDVGKKGVPGRTRAKKTSYLIQSVAEHVTDGFTGNEGLHLKTGDMISGKMNKAGKGEPHVFKEKTFKKKRQCGVCRQNIDNVGSFCRVCKTATHRKCEGKVRIILKDLHNG
ncbi:hypothetical protein CHARACLAT_009463 [Characodon lateralis]|uniref:Phorbol-ester/DAG-type domain-containing protein n=1 Tax=Characodon lateralis TaxID=208331 RepID=A0ABU7ESR6_9TELE|nr:hypothetical protein [Characodon lateralis]